MASDAVCDNEYLIHHDYLLVWFNMACIMKRNTITSKMQPDSCPTGAGGGGGIPAGGPSVPE